MYKKIYIQRTRVIFLWVRYDARWSSERRINKLKQKSREREGKLGTSFVPFTIERSAVSQKKNDAQCNSWALNLLLMPNLKTRIEEDISLPRRIDHITKTLAVRFIVTPAQSMERFAKRMALYTSLSIKHDMRIRLSTRMPYVPILDERISLALEEVFKPSKTDVRRQLKSVRLEFLIVALRTECVEVDLSHERNDVLYKICRAIFFNMVTQFKQINIFKHFKCHW